MAELSRQAPIAGPWYPPLCTVRPPAISRRVAIAMGGLLSPITASIAGAVRRCGHECVDVQDAPDLIIANWWKDTLSELVLPPGVPMVHWWVGSDAHHTTAHSLARRYNWVASPWLARLLKARLDVTARAIPIVSALEPRLLPRSPTRRVLVYCPQRNRGPLKYCWKETVEIARRCPALEFTVLLKGGGSPLPNIRLVPRVKYEDMPALYAETRLLLRLTPSDATSLCVMEALGFGRHAVWNWWAPGATHVSNIKEALEAIRRLIDAAPYAGGVASALELRAQADHSMCAAIEEALS